MSKYNSYEKAQSFFSILAAAGSSVNNGHRL